MLTFKDAFWTSCGLDGSITINRTTGEMSARCDLEGHNVLTLNLAHDTVIVRKM